MAGHAIFNKILFEKYSNYGIMRLLIEDKIR